MTDIIICGANGRMGHMIYECVQGRDDCRVVAGIDTYTNQYADFPIVATPAELPVKGDVIIDFSNPASLDGLLEYSIANGTPVVFATTGYSDEEIEKIKAASEKTAVFFSWNMSMGINLLVELSKKAASFLGDQFDIEIVEKHHNQKLDAPSGTALMLANGINETFDGDKEYVYDRHSVRRKRDKKEIGIHAVRGGTIVGEHEIIFAGSDEVITLSHSAASRRVFAVGSVNAAVFVKDKKSGMYDMSDVLKGL